RRMYGAVGCLLPCLLFFFSSRRRHTRFSRDWSSDVCSSDLLHVLGDDPHHLVLDPVEELGREGLPVIHEDEPEAILGRVLAAPVRAPPLRKTNILKPPSRVTRSPAGGPEPSSCAAAPRACCGRPGRQWARPCPGSGRPGSGTPQHTARGFGGPPARPGWWRR